MKNSDSDEQKTVPLIIVGASGAGKTCILEYFVSGYMGSHLSTLELILKQNRSILIGKRSNFKFGILQGKKTTEPSINHCTERKKASFLLIHVAIKPLFKN